MGAAWICGGPGLGKKRAETIRYGVERKADGWRVMFEAGQSAFISSLARSLAACEMFVWSAFENTLPYVVYAVGKRRWERNKIPQMLLRGLCQ